MKALYCFAFLAVLDFPLLASEEQYIRLELGIRAGLVDWAKGFAQQQVQANPASATALVLQARIMELDIGLDVAKDKTIQHDAFELYSRAITKDATSAPAYARRALLHGHKEGGCGEGRLDAQDAIYHARSAEMLALAFYSRAYNQRRCMNLQLALNDFNKALNFDPLFPSIHRGKAKVLMLLGRWQDALKETDYAIALSASRSLAPSHRAYCLMELGRLDEALPEADRGVTEMPSYPEVFTTRAIIRFYKGDHDGAVADAKQAIALDPFNFSSFELHAYILDSLGRKDEATEGFRSSPSPWIKSMAEERFRPRPYGRSGADKCPNHSDQLVDPLTGANMPDVARCGVIPVETMTSPPDEQPTVSPFPPPIRKILDRTKARNKKRR